MHSHTQRKHNITHNETERDRKKEEKTKEEKKEKNTKRKRGRRDEERQRKETKENMILLENVSNQKHPPDEQVQNVSNSGFSGQRELIQKSTVRIMYSCWVTCVCFLFL